MKVSFCALGCKVNQYEADCYAKMFGDKGWSIGAFDEICDVYVVNTCAITNIGERKSRQMLRRAKKLNPDALVVATGCYAQTKAQEVMALPEIDVVIGTAKRAMLVEIVEAKMRGEDTDALTDIMQEKMYEELECAGETERTRAYIKIQDGCENFCSYCIVPYARGPVRSRKLENIVSEAKRLSDKGFKEIVLTGISVNSYGKDLKNGQTLADVIKAVCAIDKVCRVRLSSIDPRAFGDNFIKLIADEEKMCRHFHISLQSGSSSVLKRMNRKYTAKEYLDTLSAIRDKMEDALITTDIICGFPGESEKEFKETLDFVKTARFSKVHVFPYSERSGTVAARMEQLPRPLREKRAKELSALCSAIGEECENSFIGKSMDVLFEQCVDGICEGLTGNYLRVFVKSDKNLSGEICKVKIKERKGKRLWGEII